MLWLLRHADAADGHPDETRPLTKRGLTDARAAGQAMQRLGITLDSCLSSPKRRALETAELACEPFGIEVEHEPALAGSPYDPEALAAGRGEVLIVGHDPSMTLALHDLTGAQARLKKGALAGIDGGELMILLTPRELRAIAGVERR